MKLTNFHAKRTFNSIPGREIEREDRSEIQSPEPRTQRPGVAIDMEMEMEMEMESHGHVWIPINQLWAKGSNTSRRAKNYTRTENMCWKEKLKQN